MTMPLLRWLLFSTFIFMSIGASAQSTASHMHSVESGLSTRVRIVGTTTPNWTLQERMAFYHVPALEIAVVNGGSLEWTKAYGLLEAESAASANNDTRFQAASIRKVVTALTVLHLISEQRFSLDSDVNQLLKSWKLPDPANVPVTIGQLLSHSAAIN